MAMVAFHQEEVGKDKRMREMKVETEYLSKFLAAISKGKVPSTRNKSFCYSWLSFRYRPGWSQKNKILK